MVWVPGANVEIIKVAEAANVPVPIELTSGAVPNGTVPSKKVIVPPGGGTPGPVGATNRFAVSVTCCPAKAVLGVGGAATATVVPLLIIAIGKNPPMPLPK